MDVSVAPDIMSSISAAEKIMVNVALVAGRPAPVPSGRQPPTCFGHVCMAGLRRSGVGEDGEAEDDGDMDWDGCLARVSKVVHGWRVNSGDTGWDECNGMDVIGKEGQRRDMSGP
jgi:hypothetical protein